MTRLINYNLFLVNGVGTVDVAKLTAITTFNDESFNSKDEGDKSDVTRLTKWFWEVVEGLSQNERQELLYFWTGKNSFGFLKRKVK